MGKCNFPAVYWQRGRFSDRSRVCIIHRALSARVPRFEISLTENCKTEKESKHPVRRQGSSSSAAVTRIGRVEVSKIPNHLVWLCFFYLFFHSYLNLMGELLHFADRNFYCDWWNANNIDTFWRTWNMPVHRWAVRHLYIPIVEMGYSKTIASVTVFFISAFFHEYLVSVPLKTFKIWAFMGMMGQMPLSALSKLVERHWGARWGNIVVWSSLIIGQPLCILMYYHDYVVTHFGETLLEDYSVV